MNRNNIIIPYIPIGDKKTEEVRGKKFEIWSTKQESTFLPFKNKDSPPYKLCNIAKNDPGVFSLFFLKYSVSDSAIEEFPLELKLPFFLDIDNEFVEAILNEKYAGEIKRWKTKIKKILDEYGELNARYTWDIIATIMADHKFKQKISRKGIKRMNKNEIYSLFAETASKYEEKIKKFFENLSNIIKRNYSTLEQYIPTIEAYESVKDAKINMETLSNIFSEQNIGNILSDSISKLIANRIIRMQHISICLECVLRKHLEPIYIEERYPGSPNFLTHCNKCNGKTIFHQVLLQIPDSLTPLVLENRIQEFMTGFLLADSEIMKKVYVHKKISKVEDSKRYPGVEVDIFAVTEDDKIVLVEVTKTDDLDDVGKNMSIKERNFKVLDYDYLFYVTGVSLEKYFRYGDTNAYILGTKHLPKLSEHIEYIMSK